MFVVASADLPPTCPSVFTLLSARRRALIPGTDGAARRGALDNGVPYYFTRRLVSVSVEGIIAPCRQWARTASRLSQLCSGRGVRFVQQRPRYPVVVPAVWLRLSAV